MTKMLPTNQRAAIQFISFISVGNLFLYVLGGHQSQCQYEHRVQKLVSISINLAVDGMLAINLDSQVKQRLQRSFPLPFVQILK